MTALSRLSTFAALRHRNYRLFWTGAVVSLIGTWMQTTAQSYLVWELTRSPLATSLTVLFFSLPSTLLSLVGGVAADRFDRRKLVFVTQSVFTLQAAALTALTFAHVIQVWHIYLLATASGIVMAFDAPTRQSLVPALVPREDLSNAIALNSTAFNVARVVGPPLAGLVYAAAGPQWCFFVNTVSFAAILYAIWLIQPQPLPVLSTGHLGRDLREGLRYARDHAVVRATLILIALLGTFGFTYVVLMPVVASKVLGGGPAENGVLLGSAGAGATLGALSVASIRTRWPGRMIVAFGYAAALALVGLSLSHHLLLSMALTAAVAGFLMAFMATSNSTIQAHVPDILRGRIMSLYTLALVGSGPLNSLFAGALGNWLSVPAAIALSGVALGLSVAVIAARNKPLLELDMRHAEDGGAPSAVGKAALESVGSNR